jgi:hypothetical protein
MVTAGAVANVVTVCAVVVASVVAAASTAEAVRVCNGRCC